jgi:hypothetical protein
VISAVQGVGVVSNAVSGFEPSSRFRQQQQEQRAESLLQLRQVVGEGGGRLRRVGEVPSGLSGSGYQRLCPGTDLHQKVLRMRWEAEMRLSKAAER